MPDILKIDTLRKQISSNSVGESRVSELERHFDFLSPDGSKGDLRIDEYHAIDNQSLDWRSLKAGFEAIEKDPSNSSHYEDFYKILYPGIPQPLLDYYTDPDKVHIDKPDDTYSEGKAQLDCTGIKASSNKKKARLCRRGVYPPSAPNKTLKGKEKGIINSPCDDKTESTFSYYSLILTHQKRPSYALTLWTKKVSTCKP